MKKVAEQMLLLPKIQKKTWTNLKNGNKMKLTQRNIVISRNNNQRSKKKLNKNLLLKTKRNSKTKKPCLRSKELKDRRRIKNNWLS